MMRHEAAPTRVLLGPGARSEIRTEVDRQGLHALLLVASGSAGAAADEILEQLGSRIGGRFDRPVVHTPVEVTERAMTMAAQCDGIIAIGGGSAVGLSKALAARTRLPQIVLPTTYAGSEVTPVLGETQNGVKSTRRDSALIPGTVIYDAELTLSMPTGLTLTSAVNALAHAVEALWAPDRTVLSDGLATEAAEGIFVALPDVLSEPGSLSARSRLQAAAWLAGMCLAQTTMGLQHQLAHVLGGMFNAPHAELHTMLLAPVMRYNLDFAPHALTRLQRVASGDAVNAVAELASRHDGRTSLAELGVPWRELESVAARIAEDPYPNPRVVDVEQVRDLLEGCWGGG